MSEGAAAITIGQERPDTPDATALIEELDGVLGPLYPDESRHGFSVSRLIDQGVDFFVVRVDGRAAACGGVLDTADGDLRFGEVKRMYVRPAFRGMGLARRVLAHIEEHARARGIGVLRLETGIHQVEAIGLYQSAGYGFVAAFPPYVDDPLSRYLEKRLG